MTDWLTPEQADHVQKIWGERVGGRIVALPPTPFSMSRAERRLAKFRSRKEADILARLEYERARRK